MTSTRPLTSSLSVRISLKLASFACLLKPVDIINMYDVMDVKERMTFVA